MREKTRVLTVLAALVAGAVLAIAPPASAATTTTLLVSSANPSTVGQVVTLTATVTGTSPTGQVVFDDAGVPLGSAALDAAGAATLITGSLTVGSHVVTATYDGDSSNDSSSGTLTQVVAAAPAPAAPPAPPAAPPAPVKPPKVKLVASKTKASVGDKVQLRWHSKHADVVMASGDWSGRQKAKGSATVRIAERGKHVFKLTVRNASGVKTATVKVMASRKAKDLELEVTDELVLIGSKVDVKADGLAKGEDFTLRLNGKSIMTGKADKKGDVVRTFEIAKGTPQGELPLTITGSNPGRVGAAVLNVIGAATFDVDVALEELPKGAEQTISVTGLAPEEELTVMYAGTKLTQATADAEGTFTYTFPVGKKSGEKTVKVIGVIPERSGEATFTVKARSHGGGGEESGRWVLRAV